MQHGRLLHFSLVLAVAAIATGCPSTPGADGIDGKTSLVSTRTATEAECPNGGTLFEAGVDDDGDGKLDAEEVEQSTSICNGVTGPAGQDGDEGTDGRDGTDGEDGATTLLVVSEEAAGDNCAAGGQRVDYGVDDDRDGTLDAEEIDGTEYVCHGEDGEVGLATLVTASPEGEGAHCPAGGQRIDQGVDDDRDGVLDAEEIDGTQYACNGAAGTDGATGTDGYTTLATVTPEAAGDNCTAGGQRVDTGVDDDRDGVLDAGEVDSTRYVCHGENGQDGADGQDGFMTLVAVTPEAAGASCAAGGQRIQTGIDDDRDSVLDAGEVDATRYVCHGTDGQDGADGNDGVDGFTSLVVVTDEADGDNCAAGGQRIDTGIDDDRDGVLDAGEIDDTSYVCNGVARSLALVGAGIQRNLSLAATQAQGWQVCYGGNYGDTLGSTHATALAGCSGSYLMLACRDGNSDTLTVAAADTRAVVTQADAANATSHHVSGSVGWYYSPDYSWGFFPAGAPVYRNSCDTENVSAEDRLCWHMQSELGPGWRCGATTDIYSGTNWQRLILVQ